MAMMRWNSLLESFDEDNSELKDLDKKNKKCKYMKRGESEGVVLPVCVASGRQD